MVHRYQLLDGRPLTDEFTVVWTVAGHRAGCPKCGARAGELCVAEDGTEAAAGLCHAEREQS